MSILKILGSCSGTEPMPGRQHTSLVLTAGDRNYFFDAGESCARSAHLSGIDLLKTRAIFITHTHFDHIGGLGGLMWHTRKLTIVQRRPVEDGEVKIYIPEIEAWEGLHTMLRHTEESFQCDFAIPVQKPQLGTFYRDENIAVTAFHSHHLENAADGTPTSFSYRVETESGSFVFSGDIRDMDDLVEPVGAGCDRLLCESGHHGIADICAFAETHNVKTLVLVHHGKEILENKPHAAEAMAACKIPLILSEDGTEIEV